MNATQSNKLFCSVIGSDCTNHGVTSGKSHVTVECVPGADSGADLQVSINYDYKPLRAGYLVVVEDRRSEPRIARVMAWPANKERPGMFGGNFVKTSDSRFPFATPIPVFDRYEN